MTPCLPAAPLSVLLVLMDDMRADQLSVFTETLSRVSDHAQVYERAYVTTPMCCPDRASLLSGGYAAPQHGVLSNSGSYGGAHRFDDGRTLATRLQELGYDTALLGKYMNGYDALEPYVPPGWSFWWGWLDEQPWQGFEVVEGTSTPGASGVGERIPYAAYVVDAQRAATLRRLTELDPETPSFLYLTFLAPHSPHTPAVADVGAYADFVYRGGAFMEADVADKPAWLRAWPILDDEAQAAADLDHQQQLESLLSVDRAVAAILDQLQVLGRRESTLLILTSDNGMMWGEHRLFDKGYAYEESVRVPLLIAHPSLSPRQDRGLVAVNLDVPALIQSVAGLTVEGEGLDLGARLCDAQAPVRDHINLQFWPVSLPQWAAVVTDEHKLVQHATGELELYDLQADPTESVSLHDDPDAQDELVRLSALLSPGLALTTTALPDARVGEFSATTLTAWGGTPPYRFTLRRGALPPGLSLSAEGLLSGVPTATVETTITVEVQDSSTSAYHGGPQEHGAALALKVGPAITLAPEGCACGGGAGGGAAALGLSAAPVALARRRRAARPSAGRRAR
ncbi:sulfatase-like hydrolase/transferase [Myxococcota bacterium]|nr:sulfatase-like hydrolase/transferase [Myxococcota bacterium]